MATGGEGVPKQRMENQEGLVCVCASFFRKTRKAGFLKNKLGSFFYLFMYLFILGNISLSLLN